MVDSSDFAGVISGLKSWQNSICAGVSSYEDGVKFTVDKWHSKLGQGESRVLERGAIFESAGVNFSHVSGNNLPAAALPGRSELAGKPYFAAGVSTVLHPRNPFIPTAHANLRIFVVAPDSRRPIWWFGGGYDLTPYYGFIDDCVLWHKNAKLVCDRYGEHVYDDFKKNCDDYFYLKHRDEHRGIGGLFFDNLNTWGFDNCADFVREVASSFTRSYFTIVSGRRKIPYSAAQRDFQAYRRGRYVEFNLLYDRGTKFGLDSGGRTESILMSLPPTVSWRYNWQAEVGTAEHELYSRFLQPQDWVGLLADA